MKLSKIKIRSDFAATKPRQEKMNLCRYCYKRCGKLDREIVINKDNVLVDGYVGYLVLLENGVKRSKIKRVKVNKNPDTELSVLERANFRKQ